MQFQKIALPCLKRLKREEQTQEQTQELRLPDGLPDIGRVLGAWGQVILRSKEWHTGSAGVSGGVMAWVLYAPEDDSMPRSVEVWIPFQMKWELPDTERDGTLCLSGLLRALDARMLSARKLLVRAGIGVRAEAMLPGMLEISQPSELPADVQLLKNTYPIRIPREAGEKPFAIEEELAIPASMPQLSEIAAFSFLPEVSDSKVMAGRAAFRGTGTLHILYQTEDGRLQTWDAELPFSQFTDLEQEYGADAQVRFTPMLTSLEMDKMEDGRLHFSAGITCQYLVSDRNDIELVEDAYSPRRTVTAEITPLQIPIELEQQSQIIHAQQSAQLQGSTVLDVTFLADHARSVQDENGAAAELNGQFQMLYYDENGTLQSITSRWEDLVGIPADSGCRMEADLRMTGLPKGSITAGQGNMQTDLWLDTVTTAEQGLSMVTALEMGELREPDPDRPSLIICRAGKDSLWDMARAAGSTVDAIRKANANRPDTGDFLLIPIE